MRFDIRYTSRFDYASPISESQNALRACPTSDDRQTVSHYRVVTRPSARVHSYVDYWGTRVDTFGIRAPHESLEVVAECTVDTTPSRAVTVGPRPWDVYEERFRDEHLEFLAPSSHVTFSGEVSRVAAEKAEQAGDDLVGTVLSLHRLVGTSFEYAPGATYVGVDVDELFATRQGVCQDFAHVLIAMCRSIGVPARYVSGYYFAVQDDSSDEPDVDEVDVQTHAWVEAAIPEHGWLALDPTNRQQVGERHVKIGHGRDYDDVAPLKGTYIGGARHDLNAGVHMRRMVAAQEQQQQQ
ncbi:MAG: transglutaminase family protein [Actinobacteria bacterium]|nr:transglutaminase family protein [Actinomycetota bacterium]